METRSRTCETEVHSILGLATLGWMHGQEYFLPPDRFVVVRGNIRDVLGRPVANAVVQVRSFRAPQFNLDSLLAADPVEIHTDEDGEISTSRQNEVRVLRSTREEDCYVRLTIPIAGADWVVTMPEGQNVILLKDLVSRRLVVDLSRAAPK